jgi:hypothetical protein
LVELGVDAVITDHLAEALSIARGDGAGGGEGVSCNAVIEKGRV